MDEFAIEMHFLIVSCNGMSSSSQAHQNVMKASAENVLSSNPIIGGLDLNKEENQSLDRIISNYLTIGFSATALSRAQAEIERMLAWRLSDDPYDEKKAYPEDPTQRKGIRAKIFLGYTSNLVSSGLREYIRFLAQHKLIDVFVTSAGGIEEDFIKCMGSTHLGDWHLSGAALREQSVNRIGNLLISNENYCMFEDWVLPIFDECLRMQNEGYHWTPSRLIWKLGERINNPDSIYYWCWRNKIPVFCPALTDGSLGDMLFFYSYKNPGLIIDVVGDIRAMNTQTINSPKNAVIILGGGTVKHHILNANLFAGSGADFCVLCNTGQEYDGSDAGASPDEAVSWGKISPSAHPVKIYADATLVFPILVHSTFLKAYLNEKTYWDGKTYGDPHECYWTQLEFEAKDPVFQERKAALAKK